MFDVTAVVGATGAVGTLIREIMETRNFPSKKVKFIASKRSAGTIIKYKGEDVVVEEMLPEAFEGVDLVIGSTPDEVAAVFVPWAREKGCLVVDESAYYRMHDDVPLVIPEVNPDAVDNHKGIVSSPNCSTTQMVMALKALYNYSKIRRVIVTTFQATSGAGVAGNRDLKNGSAAALRGEEYQYETFAHPIAFNCMPQIGSPKHPDQFPGYTSEEVKMILETWKIMGDNSFGVCPTCVRVPVENCHSESISVETEQEITVEKARELFAAFPGIIVMDDLDNKVYPMPYLCTGKDETFIGRIRKDPSAPNTLTFWCVSDNLRKGAATNAVQIGELLAKKFSK